MRERTLLKALFLITYYQLQDVLMEGDGRGGGLEGGRTRASCGFGRCDDEIHPRQRTDKPQGQDGEKEEKEEDSRVDVIV